MLPSLLAVARLTSGSSRLLQVDDLGVIDIALDVDEVASQVLLDGFQLVVVQQLF